MCSIIMNWIFVDFDQILMEQFDQTTQAQIYFY